MIQPTTHLWRVRVLGAFSVDPTSGGDRHRLDLILRRPQTVALIAILATAGRRGIPREKLLELLWHDGDTLSNRNALAQLLFRTRRTLGPATLTGRQTLRLSEHLISTDIADFWQAIERGDPVNAIALHTGALLDGLDDWETPALARWIAVERVRFDDAFHAALDQAGGRTPRDPSPRARELARYARHAAMLFLTGVLILVLASWFYLGSGHFPGRR